MYRKLFLTSMLLLFWLLPNSAHGQWLPTAGPSHDAITCLASTELRLFAGTSKGAIFRSTDGGDTWANADSGLTCTHIYNISMQNATLFSGTDSGLYISTDNGFSWSSKSVGLTSRSVYSVAGTATMLLAATDSGIFVSSSEAESWQPADSGLTFLRVLSLVVSNTNLIAGTAGGGFYLSKDGGAHWSAISFAPGFVDVRKLFVSGDLVYAAVGYLPPVVAYYAGVCMSTDHGESWNWRSVFGSIEGGGMVVHDFASHGTNLFEAVSWLAFMNPTINGVFLSCDSGKSWSPVVTGLQDSNAISLAVFGSDLFAGTSSAGVWKRPLAEMTTSVPSPPLQPPREFNLGQNFPNPFNPSTSIRYQLPAAAPVTLKVYDILGREVQTLVNERQNAGVHSVIFDAGDLSSGVYFYTLQAERFKETKKFLLLK